MSESSYDPWRDLAARWPGLEVRVAPLSGDLLGELCYPVITRRAGTSAAQRRCTLAHEIVHLDRGIEYCGPFAAREELLVHREAARRLVTVADLAAAVRGPGAADSAATLAAALDVDTLTVRLALLTPRELDVIRRAGAA